MSAKNVQKQTTPDAAKKAAGIVKKMKTPLRDKYQQLKVALAKADRGDATARYKIGVIVHGVDLGGKKYGTDPVGQLAAALGKDPNTLYEYSRVAGTWPLGKFTSILSKRNAFGLTLSWTHFVVLSYVKAEKPRTALTKRALLEGLTVERLRALIGAGRPTNSVPSVRTTFGQAVKTMKSMAEGLLEKAKALDAPMFRGIEKATDKAISSSEGLLDNLREAEMLNDRLEALCQTNKPKLTASIERVTKVMSAISKSEEPVKKAS